MKLLETGELCVCDIVAAFDLIQPKVSFHLSALKEAGLISKEFMKTLPEEIVFASAGKRVKLLHAAPRKNNLYWHEDRPEKFFQDMAEKAGADVRSTAIRTSHIARTLTAKSSLTPAAWENPKTVMRGHASQ